MKHLYKKISAVFLSSALLIGGYLSNGVIIYANSFSSGSFISINNNIWVSNDDDDIADVKSAVNIYNYKILAIDPSNAAIKVLSRYSSIKNFQSFKSGGSFLEYLKNSGMKKGIYKIKVGKHIFILEFKKNVEPGIDVFKNLDKLVNSPEKDKSEVIGGQKLHHYEILEYLPNKNNLDAIKEKYSGAPCKNFKSGMDFLIDLCFDRPAEGIWILIIGEQVFVIKFDKLY